MEIKLRCPDSIHVPRRGKRDRKPSFSINPAKNVGRCWSCGYVAGNARQFCEEHGITLNVDWGAPADPNWGVKKPRPQIQLPKEYTRDFGPGSIFGPRALKYLLKRGISRTLVTAYEIGHCPTGHFAYRIIIPVYEEGVLATFQARDWSGIETKVRYTGPKGGKPNVLFNISRAQHSKVLLLVEGPFDALRIPEHGVGVLGKGWNADKRAKILRARPSTVYICLDQDAPEENEQVYQDLVHCVPHVEHIQLNGAKDLGEAKPAELERVRYLCRAAVTAARLAS